MLNGNKTTIGELVPVMRQLFAEGKTVKIVARGRSMMPLLRDGEDSVVLAACNVGELKKRDVVLYRRENGKYVLHRVVAIKGDELTMCGDGQIALERGVKKSDIAAKAVAFYTHGRYIAADSFLHKAYAFLWCAVLPHRFRIYRVWRAIFGRKRP